MIGLTIQGVPQLHECRPEVLAFARLMELKLRKHDGDYEGNGWKSWDYAPALGRLKEETTELEQAIPRIAYARGSENKQARIMEVGFESADVGNFAMMIADMAGALDGMMPAVTDDGPTFTVTEIRTLQSLARHSPVRMIGDRALADGRRLVARGLAAEVDGENFVISTDGVSISKALGFMTTPTPVTKCDYCGGVGETRGTPILADVPARICEACWNVTRDGGKAAEGMDIGPFKEEPASVPVWNAQCFLCGANFRTTHDPLKVPPACDDCREQSNVAKLDNNNL